MINEGGAIVPSGQCSAFEIAHAGACHRFAIDQHGFGYVLRSQDWVKMADEGLAVRLYEMATMDGDRARGR